MGKLWGTLSCEYIGKSRPCYIGGWLQLYIQLLYLPYTGLILGLRLANERWRYFVTMSLIGWAQT